MCFTVFTANPLSVSVSKPLHPDISKHFIGSFIYFTVLPTFIALSPSTLYNLSLPASLHVPKILFSFSLPPISVATHTFQIAGCAFPIAGRPMAAASLPYCKIVAAHNILNEPKLSCTSPYLYPIQ